MFGGESQYSECKVTCRERSTVGSVKPPAVAVPKYATNAKNEYDYSPTKELKLRSGSVDVDKVLENNATAASPRLWQFLKKGEKEFKIRAIETSAERKNFDWEVQDAKEKGFSVEFVTAGGQMVVFMELMGELLGKAGAKRAMDRALDGGNIIAFTELILRAEGAASEQLCQLIPDISGYPIGFTSLFRSTAPPHSPIVVEIDWIEDRVRALNKRIYYFAATFVAPDGSMVMEVWNLFLARSAPTLPALTVPVPTNTLPFAGVDAILNAAAAMGAEEPTIIVFHHRNGAYPPSYGVLDWNTSLTAPAGSLFTGRLDANTILRLAYQI